jgi:hypothetical protein
LWLLLAAGDLERAQIVVHGRPVRPHTGHRAKQRRSLLIGARFAAPAQLLALPAVGTGRRRFFDNALHDAILSTTHERTILGEVGAYDVSST